jgi:broad specificity phosphatase PhoE
MHFPFFLLLFLIVSCSQRVYVVRHAEKQAVLAGATAMEASDPPLSAAGELRALALRDLLRRKQVRHVFSTDYRRTRTTALPLCEARRLPLRRYSAKKDSLASFCKLLHNIRNGSILVVGHSNTVDDLVNALAGRVALPSDLQDGEYDRLFILRRKGKGYAFRASVYGERSLP